MGFMKLQDEQSVIVRTQTCQNVSSDNCNRDYVEVHSESAAGPLLGHFCGSAVPSNVTVGNKLWIKFRSDDRGTTGGGFVAEYNLRECSIIFKRW